MRCAWALAALVVAAVGAQAGGAPAGGAVPAPRASPTLAPLTLPASAPSPGPAASPASDHLKVIERLYVNAYCSRFVAHFNEAADVLIANDTRLQRTSSLLDTLDRDYVRYDGPLRVYDDRNRLISEVGAMMRTIPAGQTAVNALLAQSHEAGDPQRSAALRAAASNLQQSIDRQRAVAYDLSNVIHVLLDKHTAEDTAEYQIAETMPYPNMPVNVHALDDPVPQPGATDAAQALAPEPPTIKEVLQFHRQRWIIGHAESRAASSAETVMKTCITEEHSSSGLP